MFPGFDLYYADPAQPLIKARDELLIDYLDYHIPEVWSIVPGTQ